MKKLIVNIVVALCAVGAFAAQQQKKQAAEPEPEMLKFGGEGKVAVVNACDAPTNALDFALRKIANLMMFNYEIQKGEWKLAEAQKCFDAAKANVAIFVIKDKSLPISLVAMESKWGVVNAEGLDEKSLMRETMRVATVVLGGASSKYTASTMRPVFSKEDLANKTGDLITFDSIMAISPYLSVLGIKPYQMMTREDAIAEGLIKADAKK